MSSKSVEQFELSGSYLVTHHLHEDNYYPKVLEVDEIENYWQAEDDDALERILSEMTNADNAEGGDHFVVWVPKRVVAIYDISNVETVEYEVE